MKKPERDRLRGLLERIEQGHHPCCGQGLSVEARGACNCQLPRTVRTAELAAFAHLGEFLHLADELDDVKDRLAVAGAWLKAESDDIDFVTELVRAGQAVIDSESDEGCSPCLTVVSRGAFHKLKRVVEREPAVDVFVDEGIHGALGVVVPDPEDDDGQV